MSRMYQKLNFILIILCLVGLPVALLPRATLAESTIEVVDQTWNADFREELTFTLNARSTAEIVEVELFYRVVGRPATSRNEADFVPGTSIQAEFVIDQTKPENYLPPGTELQYWWRITDAEGNELKTEPETLLYLDDRYDWRTLENERLTLYWYEGDENFGQKLFERANLALDTLETDFGVVVEDPIKIFIYATHQDLLGAISTTAQEWTGGQAFTNYGVVVLAVDVCPQRDIAGAVCISQLPWGLNATTHEITHLVIHQATENPYGDLPRWLDEGIAVYNENRDGLDEDFRPIFEEAVKNNQLMTLRTLSSPFPSDPRQANLAYGQSGAVVKFIIDTYGSEKMAELLDIFSEGAIYDEALEQALGLDTDGLDNAFRESLGLSPLPGTENDSSPAEQENGSEEDETEGVEEESEQPGQDIEEPSSDEAPVEESAGQDEVAELKEENSLGLPCLAGILPLLALGLVMTMRRKV